jgi:REP element-mobilizing transposase RayT
MHRRFRKSSVSRDKFHNGLHRFEHWYLDNAVYFITSRCRNRYPAFASEGAKATFWDRFALYSGDFGFVPWVTTLLDNHYHTIGHLRVGENLGKMMQRLHGSVAKLVNDLLSERLSPFWYDSGKQGYFDGCIRDELQARRAYRYIVRQSERHGLARDWRTYRHTVINVELERAVKRAHELKAFLHDVPYRRYLRKGEGDAGPSGKS